MFSSMKYRALSVGLLLGGFTTGAQAATYQDTYIGGLDNSSYTGGLDNTDTPINALNPDVIGTSQFQVYSMDVERIGDALKVVLNTNYADNVGLYTTRVGSLFLGTIGNLDYTGTAPEYTDDTFALNPTRFTHAFDYDGSSPTGYGTGDGSLYLLDNVADVVQSQVAYTGGGIFRHDQAVDITNSATDTGVGGKWTISVGKITFEIYDFFSNPETLGGVDGIYATSLVLAWGMTCANDYILVEAVTPLQNIDVPLPASVLLLLSGLGGLGFLNRTRRRTAKVAT